MDSGKLGEVVINVLIPTWQGLWSASMSIVSILQRTCQRYIVSSFDPAIAIFFCLLRISLCVCVCALFQLQGHQSELPLQPQEQLIPIQCGESSAALNRSHSLLVLPLVKCINPNLTAIQKDGMRIWQEKSSLTCYWISYICHESFRRQDLLDTGFICSQFSFV